MISRRILTHVKGRQVNHRFSVRSLGMASIYQRGKTWYIHYYVNGKSEKDQALVGLLDSHRRGSVMCGRRLSLEQLRLNS